jgi:hypothetical protein
VEFEGEFRYLNKAEHVLIIAAKKPAAPEAAVRKWWSRSSVVLRLSWGALIRVRVSEEAWPASSGNGSLSWVLSFVSWRATGGGRRW